ncbi:max dimerization protein 1-like [Artemia franciscana]|uniref:max dimerization protein 1-like n=1 Tax=Artemia franciscana TaxID=6661 RepID=UPI0032DBAAA9
MSISALLQAAEYLDKKDKDHVYCTSGDMDSSSDSGSSSRSFQDKALARSWPTSGAKQRKTSTSDRVSHNELEKSRRAHLRTCLDKLRELVPISETARHTTLGLLTRGRLFIQALEERDRRCMIHKESLYNKQRVLKRRLAELSYEIRQLQQQQVQKDNESLRRLHTTSETSQTTSMSEPVFFSAIEDAEIEVDVELKTEYPEESYSKNFVPKRSAHKESIAKTLNFEEQEYEEE